MEYKIYSKITCSSRRCNGKYWRRSSLLRNLLNVKHHTPYKSIYSKYQIIKNIGKLLSKYELFFLDQGNSSSDPSQILIQQYPIPTTGHHKDWIYQTICQAKPIKFFIKLYTDHNTLLVKLPAYQKTESFRAASLSKLDNTVNNNAMLNSLENGRCSFIFTTLYLPPLQSLPKIRSSISVNFPLPTSPSFVHKIILAIQTNTPFYYSTTVFSPSFFLQTTIPKIYTQNIFPTSDIYPIQAEATDQGARESCED